MYYLAKVRFETETDKGKIKQIREQFLVEADTVGDAEKKVMDKFGDGISPCHLEGVNESKILDVLE